MTLARASVPVSALFLLAAGACAAPAPDLAVARDNDPPLADRDELFEGAPSPDEIPSEWKADGLLPARFDIRASQSEVKSQGRRGVCSIFAGVGLMEHLYILAGDVAPDFSEQYLQWAVKSELGAFPGSSGSNSVMNLQAISQLGIPEEAAWPYEIDQWSTLNDPECGAEDPLPTRCYTNGDPSDAARAAEKFFLPSGRFLSRRDIKAHIHGRGQAVTVGFDFFYQAWNHRKSTLPTSPENWNDGIVLYPNEDDRRISLEKRAGHEILLIGWDDEMEVPRRDKDGDVVVDEAGQPVVETGFYLFKNSWGREGFGIENPFGAGYGWIAYRYVDEFASARVSDVPTLRPATEAACDDGADDDGDGAIDCDDADCAVAPTCQGGGGTELTFDGPGGQAIPDAAPAGVSSTIDVADGRTIAALTVEVAVDHSYRGDLRVTLTHGDRTVVLHDRAGGSADDLALAVDLADWNGESVAGAWTLSVVDAAAADVGTLTSWSLTARVD